MGAYLRVRIRYERVGERVAAVGWVAATLHGRQLRTDQLPGAAERFQIRAPFVEYGQGNSIHPGGEKRQQRRPADRGTMCF